MLNFTKTKIFIIYLLFLIIGFFSLLNIQNNENKLIDKKVNLGLDLQGGSYLLLEINTNPLIAERIQDKVLPLKKLLKKNEIIYKDFTVDKKSLSFEIENKDLKKLNLLFFAKKDNLLNQFINKYNTYELDLLNTNNKITVLFSKYGILTINNSALKQSIEIVRRRIDDVGIKEPII